MYICYFCKSEIEASKKTEVFYRSKWIYGCYDCFIVSINKEMAVGFQDKNY